MNVSQPPVKSTLITALAWTFIVLGALSTLSGIVGIILSDSIFTSELLALLQPPNQFPKRLLNSTQFFISNLRVIMLTYFLVSIGTLAAAIGLLKRKNWARLIFIPIMILGIIGNIGGFMAQLWTLPLMAEIIGFTLYNQMRFEIITMNVVNGLSALAFSLAHIWIIKRLVSTDIKQEFQ